MPFLLSVLNALFGGSCCRFFVIEGTDSVATWQTNISFDPVTFEDDELNIRIHRGVYQAAQALYPIVERYVEQHAGAMSVNDSPKFVLTGLWP